MSEFKEMANDMFNKHFSNDLKFQQENAPFEIDEVSYKVGYVDGHSKIVPFAEDYHQAKIMDWIKVKNKVPPKRNEAYQVLTITKEIHSHGNYKGKRIKRVVQDWVVRNYSHKFIYWLEIKEPTK